MHLLRRWVPPSLSSLTLRSKKRRAPPGEGGSAENQATNALSLRASLVEQEKGVRPAVTAFDAVRPGREGAGVAMGSSGGGGGGGGGSAALEATKTRRDERGREKSKTRAGFFEKKLFLIFFLSVASSDLQK